MLPIVGAIGGLHAQVMSSAELSVAARVEGVTRGDVATALWDERTLVKTWAMRGTLHLLPTSAYPLFQSALSRYRHYEKDSWLRGFGVTREEMDALLAAVPEALDGRLLTREELAAAVVDITAKPGLGEKVMGSWGSLLKPSAYRGDLCFGPNLGPRVRFARPDQWLRLPAAKPADPDAAWLEIVRLYLRAYGPATRGDLAHWWAGVSPAAAGRAIAALGDEVTAVEVDAVPHWALAADAAELAETAHLRTVRLLPAFDPYVIAASTHADGLLTAPRRNRIYRSQGWLSPVILVGGRFAGVWKFERKGGRVDLTSEPFEQLPAWAQKAAGQEVERIRAFLAGSA
jgi:hypothetical protein